MHATAGRVLVATLAGLSLAALSALPAAAAPVYGTPVTGGDLNAGRSVDPGGGLRGFADYETDFSVAWAIDFDTTTPGLWHYKYTFTGLDGSGQEKDISHFTLDLSPDCLDPGDLACVTNAKMTFDETVTMLMDGSDILSCGGEPCVNFGDNDGITGSVKFDIGDGEGVMYEFDSNRAPVWGNLAIKDGGGNGTCADVIGGGSTSTNIACNIGLLDGDMMDTNDFVARPNGAIPEPGTGALVGLGLVLLGRRARRD